MSDHKHYVCQEHGSAIARCKCPGDGEPEPIQCPGAKRCAGRQAEYDAEIDAWEASR